MGNARAEHAEEFSGLQDVVSAPKYASHDAYYVGPGVMSFMDDGSFRVSRVAPEPKPATLECQAGSSHLKSDSTRTTLGSPEVDTKDGRQMNPLGELWPSSHMTPAKTWVSLPVLKISNQDAILIGLGLLAASINPTERKRRKEGILTALRKRRKHLTV